MSSENIWNLLGKLDVVFGVLGGLSMVWAFIVWLRVRFQGNNEVPEEESPSGAHTLELKYLEIVVRAKGSIAFVLGTFLFITLSILFFNSSGLVVEWISYVFFITLSAIFVGLIVGSIIDVLIKGEGAAINGAVFGAFALAIIAVVVEASTGIGRPIAFISFIGAIVLGWVGFYFEHAARTAKYRERYIMENREVSWETADEIAIVKLKEKLKDRFSWHNHRVRVDHYTHDEERGWLTIVIEWEHLYSEWIPKEWYEVEITQFGEILGYSNITES